MGDVEEFERAARVVLGDNSEPLYLRLVRVHGPAPRFISTVGEKSVSVVDLVRKSNVSELQKPAKGRRGIDFSRPPGSDSYCVCDIRLR